MYDGRFRLHRRQAVSSLHFQGLISGKIVYVRSRFRVDHASRRPLDQHFMQHRTLHACERQPGASRAPEHPHNRYFRSNACRASIASLPGNSAARSAVAAGLPARFSQGSFGLDPARHRLAERAAEIDRPQTVRHHFDGDAVQAKSACRASPPDRPAGPACAEPVLGIGEGEQHRDQRARDRHGAGHPAHLVERHVAAPAAP